MIREMEIRVQGRRIRRSSREGLPMEFFGILYFLLIVFTGGVLVWQPARVAEMNEEIAVLDATLRELKLQSEALRKTVSGIESLDYVEREARTRLGMVSPQEVRTVAIEYSSGDDSHQTDGVAGLPREGILSLFGRIAQIFGVREATAKGQR